MLATAFVNSNRKARSAQANMHHHLASPVLTYVYSYNIQVVYTTTVIIWHEYASTSDSLSALNNKLGQLRCAPQHCTSCSGWQP